MNFSRLAALLILGGSLILLGACGTAGSLESALNDAAARKPVDGRLLLSLPLRQAWREVPEADIRPAIVKFYQGRDSFHVVSALRDDSIGNSATGFNEETWLTGDVFEIFLQTDADTYYEFHVTPENRNLFLRWTTDSFAARREGTFDLSDALIDDPNFIHSETSIDRANGLWTVYARIPYSSLDLELDRSVTDLKVAFTRYDAAPGDEEPILSATPHFERPDFHDRSAWHPVEIESER